VLALLLVVRRLVMRRLEREDDQRGQHLAVLAERNRDLDEFAHRVAHDLKGLVNPITGYASLISEAPEDTPRVTRYAARISRKTDEVVAMVDELLRLARAGNVSRGPSALGAVAAAVLEQFEAEVIGSDARVTLQIGEVAVNLGEVPLREVLQNLLQNSLKYRAPDRPLEVVMSAAVDEEMVRLQVRDNGVGMSNVVARHAHEPFFRASFDRDVPGSGLGLAIVHRIATAHGGSLHVESTEGAGTTVVVMLPAWSPRLSG
jgi:signal transduction histidine kinase